MIDTAPTSTLIPASMVGAVGDVARAREAQLLEKAADLEIDARWREAEIAAGRVTADDLAAHGGVLCDPAVVRAELEVVREEWMDAVLVGDAMRHAGSPPQTREQLLAQWPDWLDRAVRDLQYERKKQAARDRASWRLCHDWPTDPRPLSECLQEWGTLHGVTWGVRRWLSEQLHVPEATIKGWIEGRARPASEPLIRQVMTWVDERARRELFR